DAAAEARQPPPATSEARQPGVHLSSERMETLVDTTIVKDVLEHDSGWLLIMASTPGEVIGWVERYCFHFSIV
ncbi:hypothetical protein GOP47_0028988, partial [Adiantum capillus-veneris]